MILTWMPAARHAVTASLSKACVGVPPPMAAILLAQNYPSIWVSPQIEIACPEMVLPRGLHMNTIWSASCCGVT